MNRNRKLHTEKGFTLIELLAVIVIVGIITAIAVPGVTHLISQSSNDICIHNQRTIERTYERELDIKRIVHTDLLFATHIRSYHEDELCTEGGSFTYQDGKVICDKHSDNDGSEEEDSVPIL